MEVSVSLVKCFWKENASSAVLLSSGMERLDCATDVILVAYGTLCVLTHVKGCCSACDCLVDRCLHSDGPVGCQGPPYR
uniref:Uncharacterized protein n=1 Tax=Octopus bimaculoides TaxID=37653 RepID=A0A0L8H5Q9_OCTBM